MLVERKDTAHIGYRPVDQERNPLNRRITLICRLQMAHGAQDDIDFLDNMHRQTDRPRLVHDATLDILAYPPSCISREPEPALRIKFLQSMDQTEVSLLDQVKQWNAPVQIVLGNVHDQPQIVLDHALARGKITLPDKA